MHEFCVPLDVPDPRSELLQEDVDRALILPGHHPFFNADNFHVPESLITLLGSLGLTMNPKRTFMFRLAPYDMGPIHLDGDPKLKKLRPHGINFSWGAENTETHWFEKKEPDYYTEYRGISLPYYIPQNHKLLFSKVLTGCNLLNLEYPHRVKNLTNENRLSISLGIMEDISWEDFVQLVTDHGLALK